MRMEYSEATGGFAKRVREFWMIAAKIRARRVSRRTIPALSPPKPTVGLDGESSRKSLC